MTTYAALVRGINVGKARRVAMSDLRALVTAEGFTDPRTLTFHGTALAIVQPGYRAGRATVRVSSPGLEGGELTLRIG